MKITKIKQSVCLWMLFFAWSRTYRTDIRQIFLRLCWLPNFRPQPPFQPPHALTRARTHACTHTRTNTRTRANAISLNSTRHVYTFTLLEFSYLSYLVRLPNFLSNQMFLFGGPLLLLASALAAPSLLDLDREWAIFKQIYNKQYSTDAEPVRFVCVCVLACVSLCWCWCVCVCQSLSRSLSLSVSLPVSVCSVFVCVCAFVSICVFMCVCVCTCTHVCACWWVCACVRVWGGGWGKDGLSFRSGSKMDLFQKDLWRTIYTWKLCVRNKCGTLFSKRSKV